MDFIERLFHISPDGGSGWLEFLLVALPVLAIAAWRRRLRVWRLRQHDQIPQRRSRRPPGES